jgi:hypothetical protein
VPLSTTSAADTSTGSKSRTTATNSNAQYNTTLFITIYKTSRLAFHTSLPGFHPGERGYYFLNAAQTSRTAIRILTPSITGHLPHEIKVPTATNRLTVFAVSLRAKNYMTAVARRTQLTYGQKRAAMFRNSTITLSTLAVCYLVIPSPPLKNYAEGLEYHILLYASGVCRNNPLLGIFCEKAELFLL